jgi:hypothetical protein
MLFCWNRCSNSARQKALYWRPVHLITIMQAQAWFNQQLPALLPVLLRPPPFFEGGVSGCGFSGGSEAASTAGACSSAGEARVDRGINCVGVRVVGAYWHGCILGDEDGFASGLTPEQRFLKDVLVESSERVAESCPKIRQGVWHQVL